MVGLNKRDIFKNNLWLNFREDCITKLFNYFFKNLADATMIVATIIVTWDTIKNKWSCIMCENKIKPNSQ